MRSSSAFLTLRSALRSPVGAAALLASLDMVLCAWAKGAAVTPTASASAAAIEQSLSVMIGILVSEKGEAPVLQSTCQDRGSYGRRNRPATSETRNRTCLLYTSDAADERSSVDLGG